MEMKGIYAAMVTAFQEDGSLDERGIREIAVSYTHLTLPTT